MNYRTLQHCKPRRKEHANLHRKQPCSHAATPLISGRHAQRSSGNKLTQCACWYPRKYILRNLCIRFDKARRLNRCRASHVARQTLSKLIVLQHQIKNFDSDVIYASAVLMSNFIQELMHLSMLSRRGGGRQGMGWGFDIFQKFAIKFPAHGQIIPANCNQIHQHVGPTSGEERFKYPLPRENKIGQMPYPRTNKDNQIPDPCPASPPPGLH